MNRFDEFEEYIQRAEDVYKQQIYIVGDINCNLLAQSSEYTLFFL